MGLQFLVRKNVGRRVPLHGRTGPRFERSLRIPCVASLHRRRPHRSVPPCRTLRARASLPAQQRLASRCARVGRAMTRGPPAVARTDRSRSCAATRGALRRTSPRVATEPHGSPTRPRELPRIQPRPTGGRRVHHRTRPARGLPTCVSFGPARFAQAHRVACAPRRPVRHSRREQTVRRASSDLRRPRRSSWAPTREGPRATPSPNSHTGRRRIRAPLRTPMQVQARARRFEGD